VAARKIEGLVACGAVVTVVAEEVGAEVAAMPGLEVHRRRFTPTDVADRWLVVAATNSSTANREIYLAAEAARVWCNSVDDPTWCSYTLPAVVRQGPIVVTVGTGGHSPALATWMKGHVVDNLGPEFVTLARLLSEVRAEIRAAGRSTEGLDWHKAIDGDMLEMVRAGHLSRARERIKACL
jgi:siroheme synthase-like protein